MRRFADLFQWRRGREPRPRASSQARKKGLLKWRKKKEQKQEEQKQEEQKQEEQKEWEQQAQQEQQEQEREQSADRQSESTSRVTTQPSSEYYSDLEDDVFEGGETRSLDLVTSTPLDDHRCHDHQNSHQDDHQGDSVAAQGFTGPWRRHSKTLPASLLLPTIMVEGQQQQQQEGVGHARHMSDSQVLARQTPSPQSASPPPSPPPPTPPPSPLPPLPAVFNVEDVAVAGAMRNSPYRAARKAPFTVKYTKVFGEADGAYKNDSRPRGLVFVCNFARFLNNKYSPRVGSDKDYNNLVNLLTQMGYNPDHRRRRYCMTGSITRAEFLQRLQEFATEVKHKLLCSCVVILMSHGTGPRTFVTSDNLEVDLLDVYKIFDNINCPFLKGKPKIFILQFCRGQEASPGAMCRQERSPGSPGRQVRPQVDDSLLEKMVRQQVSVIMQEYFTKHRFTQGDNHLLVQQITEHVHSRQPSLASLTSAVLEADYCEDGDTAAAVGGGGGGGGCEVSLGECQVDGSVIPSLPVVGLQRYSDMYSIFSTSPGELSQRHPAKGSLLIQAICHVFAEFAYQDEIDTLVRRVSTYMTKTLQRDDPVTVPRQTCERTNNGLDKPFYFNPYEMAHNRQLTI